MVLKKVKSSHLVEVEVCSLPDLLLLLNCLITYFFVYLNYLFGELQFYSLSRY